MKKKFAIVAALACAAMLVVPGVASAHASSTATSSATNGESVSVCNLNGEDVPCEDVDFGGFERPTIDFPDFPDFELPDNDATTRTQTFSRCNVNGEDVPCEDVDLSAFGL
jgi:type 1 fimbria pilin